MGAVAGLGAFLAKAVISIVVSRIINEVLAPSKPSRRDLKSQQEGLRGIKLNSLSTDAPLKVIYGQLRVGGNDVYRNVTGDDNKELWVVQTLAEGECDSISDIKLGDKDVSDYGSNVSYWFHSGTATQTYDTNLNAVDPRWTDNYRYTAYIVWKLIYDQDKFQSLPERTVLLKGKKVYDFRSDTTAWSDNPVLCLYDFMTNTRYGLGLESSRFDTAAGGTWEAAANYCDTKGWSLNMAIDDSKAALDWIEDILMHFRGRLRWWDGKFYLHYSDLNYESSALTIDDSMILQDSSGKAVISVEQPRMLQKPDIVRVAYVRSDKEYTTDYVMIGDTEGAVRDLELSGCTDRQQAATLGTYWLERWQLDRRVRLTARDQCVQLEEGDVVTLDTSALSISDQLMRVVEATYQNSGLIDLVLEYESTDLYDDVYNINTEATYSTTLPDPSGDVPSVGNASISEETYDYRLRTMVKLNVTFDPPTNYPWFSHVEVWISYDDSSYVHQFNAAEDFEIPNVEEGRTYYVKLRTVNIWGAKENLDTCTKLSRIVTGVSSTAPPSLGSLNVIVSGSAVNVYSNRINNPDIELYEFRLGSSWAGGTFLSALRSPNLSLQGVKPGQHYFAVNTLGANGIYGDTPQVTAVSLVDPPDGWTVQHTETDDYSGGTHDNTEQTTYNSEYYLKCSHSGGDLTGTYLSPIFDLGASDRYLVYVLADIVVSGVGTTWDDVIPDPNTWNSISIDSRTWVEIFELSAGPQVRIKLKYGDTSPPTNEVERMEILYAIVTGRYFQVEIQITDPSEAVNALVEHFTLKFCQ